MKKILNYVLTLGFVVGCTSNGNYYPGTHCSNDKLTEYYNKAGAIYGQSYRRTYEEISFIVDCNRINIQKVYNSHKTKEKRDVGKIVFEITILPSGEIRTASVVKSDIKNGKLLDDLVNKMALLKFASKEAETMIVTYPMNFRNNW